MQSKTFTAGLDICNGSICRNRIGKGATGPLTWLTQARGFESGSPRHLSHLPRCCQRPRHTNMAVPSLRVLRMEGGCLPGKETSMVLQCFQVWFSEKWAWAEEGVAFLLDSLPGKRTQKWQV